MLAAWGETLKLKDVILPERNVTWSACRGRLKETLRIMRILHQRPGKEVGLYLEDINSRMVTARPAVGQKSWGTPDRTLCLERQKQTDLYRLDQARSGISGVSQEFCLCLYVYITEVLVFVCSLITLYSS